MKKLILFTIILLTFSLESSASHAAGGTIWYEYIGDSTGIQHHYVIHLELLRRNESGSATFGNLAAITINSSCYATQNINLQRINPPNIYNAGDGGFIPKPNANCSNAHALDYNLMNVSIHRYKKDIILPGFCSDYIFSYTNCCMNSNISNLLNPSANSIYLDAKLNNFLGPNTSPRFEISPVLSFCINKLVNTYHSAIEPNGDSLFYKIAAPLQAKNQPITYAPGYNLDTPITTLNGVHFDSVYGIMSFTPIYVENDVVKVKVQEYRIDTATQAYMFVGVTSRQVQYQIVATCDTTTFAWTLKKDSLGIDAAIKPNCLDSVVKFKTVFPYVKSSLAVDGSDFILIDVDAGNDTIPIISASTNSNNSSVFSNEVWLHTSQPIYHDGKYKIVSQIGSDTNTIVNICGNGILEHDTVAFIVTDCQSAFAIGENRVIKLEVYPSPANDYIKVKLPNIESNNTAQFIVYNLHGQQMLSGDFKLNTKGAQRINVSELPVGLYSIKLTASAGESYSAKFLKK